MGQNNPTVVFLEPKKVTIENRALPSPGDNGLLVQTTRTLISTGTELTILNGEFPKDSADSRTRPFSGCRFLQG